MGIKDIFEKLTGIDKIKADAIRRAEESIREARAAEESAKEIERIAKEEIEAKKKAEEEAAFVKMTPKERATAKGEPWVSVLETHVNKDNIRNGFFELDWNEQFVLQLKQAGYGFDGDPDEEIVDRWFRDLARNMLTEDGLDASRGAGFINVNRIGGGRAEVV
jgi:hypothetical protein